MTSDVQNPVEPWMRWPRWSRAPAAALWQAGAALRQSRPWKARDARPVIAVGNLQVGGTGKTPMVLWLLRFLRDKGLRPGMLSRGYGREGSAILRVDPAGDARRFGDEPLLVARSGFAVAVGADRAAAAKLLTEVDVLVLDDAFQQRSLQPDLSLLLFDPGRAASDEVIPLGVLRQPLQAVAEADVLLWRADTGGHAADCKALKLARQHSIEVVEVGYAAPELTPLAPGNSPGDKPLLAAGIASRQNLIAALRTQNIMVVDADLRDHEDWGARTLGRLKAQVAREAVTSVLITTKDEVKRRDWATCLGVPVFRIDSPFAPCTEEGQKLLTTKIEACLKGKNV